jgi:hypothetical protein
MPAEGLSLLDAQAGSSHDLRIVWRRPPYFGVDFASTSTLPA